MAGDGMSGGGVTDRRPISKKTRFEVFKRDQFTCQYCGRHPPEIILEVDHILAVVRGGENDEDNLLTSCFDCNRGKGARDLKVAPQSLKDKAAEVAEREAQILGYQAIMAERRERLEIEIWEIVRELDDKAETFRRDRLMSIRKFIERLGFDEVLESAQIAKANFSYPNERQFKYFCGVCWKKIKDMADA